MKFLIFHLSKKYLKPNELFQRSTKLNKNGKAIQRFQQIEIQKLHGIM